MKEEIEAREKVLNAGLKLLKEGLVARTWGNVSARINDEEFIITPSGKGYDDLKLEDLVKVKIFDCSYEGEIKPSSEKSVHAAAYSVRKDIKFIIHTHQFYASAIAAEEKDLSFVRCAKYGLPGTSKLKRNLIKAIKDNPEDKMFLMAKHGALILGESMDDAFNLSKQLEFACEKQVNLRIPSMDEYKILEFDPNVIKMKEYPFVVVTSDDYINECCKAGITVKSYVDDFAQIVGPNMKVVNNDRKSIKDGLEKRNAVLVKNVGAICTGISEEDAEAVSMIVSKNCVAACYARNSKPMGKIDSYLQRYIYQKKYSKLKDDK